MLHPYERRALTRRGFVGGLAAGLAVAGVPLAYFARRALRDNPWLADTAVVSGTKAAGPDRLPGPYRGRVVEVHHPQAVSESHRVDRSAVRTMMDRGLCEFTGADHPVEAWKTLFTPGEVIGIKVNPVGTNRQRPHLVESVSSPEVLLEVVRNLKQIG